MNAPYRDHFESLGDFLAAVIVGAPGGSGAWDDRLEFQAATGLEEGLPSRAGFLVPAEFAEDLHQRLYETGSILERCAPWPVGRENFTIPVIDERSRGNVSRHGGVVMSWIGEGQEIPASKPQFAQRQLNRRKLAGLVHVTNELLEDVQTLEAVFARLYSLEGAFVIENEVINGGGAIGPLGILNAGCTIEVAAESGQAAGTIQPANIVNMWQRLWSPSKSRAVWLVNADISPQLYGLTWSTGTSPIPLFRWGADGEPLLMGRPVLEIEQAPTLGSKGDIILADLSEYLIGDAEAIDVRFSGHVGFTSDQSAFRVRMRVDGHPAWASPTTPLNGTATVSPFVTLAAR